MADSKMTRYRNKVTGSLVRVDEKTAATLGAEFEKLADAQAKKLRSGDTEQTSRGYADLTVPDLKAEIERRNEGRDEDDLLPAEGKKAELIAGLEADDAARAEQ